ncbi:MAG: PD-(D/E)XK nuclease family protein [Bacilli bacterium]|nr:PD-(D/E)XK nuclease family protein [Bacilli bacterium]
MNKTTLYICPNSEKLNILNKFNKDKTLHNVKFMTKEEFFNNYYFSYDEKTIYYLLNKYHYNIDTIKVYLNYLYIIDLNKKYKSKKLNFLKELKQELLDNNLLIVNNNFNKFLSNKEIKVLNYYDLEKYEKDILNYHSNFNNENKELEVHEFNTLEEEVNNVCLEIIKLLKNGIDINKIYISADKEYLYTIDRLFNYYKIPINIDYKYSIYSTKVIQDYLNTGKINEESDILPKLLSIKESLLDIDSNTPEYREILISKLKNTNIKPNKHKKAINMINIYRQEISDDEYLFVLGFNNDILPKTYKDIDYISDKEKEEVDLYTSNYKNIREKNTLLHILYSIKNLYISYKLVSPFNNYYPSPLIEENNFKVLKDITDNYEYSNLYNEIRLGEKLDNYYLYNEKKDFLNELYTHYDTKYKTYSNEVDKINVEKNNLKLSYTSLNMYNECHFKYYLNYILKLDTYEDTFASFIGSMYHEILSLMFTNNFNLEDQYNKYLSTRELTSMEKLLLVKIKRNLELLLEVERNYLNSIGYKSSFYERKFTVPINDNIFEGYIDRIMYLETNNSFKYAILDYKTGNPSTDIKLTKYGLNMQLPSYLYLITNSKEFNNLKFTGLFYQRILFDRPTWSLKDNNIKKITNDNHKYIGYSTNNIERLEEFDPSYNNSNIIKSMTYDDHFGAYTKVLEDSDVDNLVKYTERQIKEGINSIKENDFSINPKVYNKENISCKFCTFKDICYKNNSNLVYLDKVEDMSFIEGDD